MITVYIVGNLNHQFGEGASEIEARVGWAEGLVLEMASSVEEILQLAAFLELRVGSYESLA